jgi:cell division protein ZipA
VEPLRWILLAVGIIFVLVIYILGRNRRRRNDSIIDELEDDLPEFSAQNLDDLDEGVGEARILTGAGFAADDDETSIHVSADTEQNDVLFDVPVKDGPVERETAKGETVKERAEQTAKAPSNIIVLYILPKADKELMGSQINSSAQAMGLTFGEMNIYHYKPENRTVFSIANMLEPGSFDADTIHDLKTSGLTIFMQISGDDPLDDLTEMLQRSYQLAGLLDARLCNHKREPLTEQDAENYRSQVSHFINGETA